MALGKRQVAPVNYLKVIPIGKKQKICLCKALNPIFVTVRLLGLFPITWVHKRNHCTYKKSLFWMVYTFFITCTHIFIVAIAIDFKKIGNSKCLIVILNDITNAVYGFYVILLTIVAYIRFPKWIQALTQLTNAIRDGVYCQSAIRISILTQYANIGLFLANISIHTGLLLWLDLSANHQNSFNYVDFSYRFLQNITYGFQVYFTAFVIVMSGTLACFEKLTKNTLQYTSMHPSKSIDESNNSTDFLGVVNYRLCKGSHQPPETLTSNSTAGNIEYLRILHEDLSLCIYMFNESMNPQLLLHTVVELAVLIIHWYAVVAYLVYTFKDPAAKAIHVLNCYYVVVHCSGLFLFLKNAQLLKNLVRF